MMNAQAEEWQKLSDIFQVALTRPADERATYLDEVCGGNAQLRERLERMLSAHERGEGFLETPAFEAIPELVEQPDARLIGQRVGRFHIERLIASGGMGTVYEATQDQPRRAVALKVMRQGFVSRSLLRRFKVETDLLGRLQHPGIAQIFEAGTADTGTGIQPFFAMELIAGRALPEYAEEQQLGIRPRLELIIKICEAVQHAHTKGIIHRDLKPANILVDRAGQPKILDFGVARATDSDIQITTLQTDVGQLIGTLPYMSPEQVVGDPAELDTRSDIYSLGVLCYELLSGRLPHELRHKPLPEAARLIREEDHTPLSSIDRIFRGDLDTIIAKALEKDKNRRYPSAQALADDIQRFLDDEPIVARAPSTAYQLRKFSRRNKALVGGIASTFIILVVGVISTTWMSVRALEEAEDGRIVTEFLSNIFSYVDPLQHGNEIQVADLVDQAARDLEEKYTDRPEVKAILHSEIADTYHSLGLYEAAAKHFRIGLELRDDLLGRDDPKTLESLNNLGLALSREGYFTEAEPLLREALERRRRVLGPEDTHTLVTMNNLGMTLVGQRKYEEAQPLLEAALAMQQRILGEHFETLTTMNNLASMFMDLGDLPRAEDSFRLSIAGLERTLGENHSTTLIAVGNLAKTLKDQQKYDEAEPLYRRYVGGLRENLGDNHGDTLIAMANWAVFLKKRSNLIEAEDMYRQVLDGFRRVFGADHAYTLMTTTGLASLLENQKRAGEAEPLLREAWAILQRTAGESDTKTIKLMDRLHKSLRQQKKTAEAQAVAEQALPALRETLGWDHPQPIRVTLRLIRLLREQRKDAAAQAVAEKALAHYDDELGAIHPETIRLTNTLAIVHQNQDHLAEAERLYRMVVADARRASIAGEQVGIYMGNHGQCLTRLKRFEEAEVVLHDAHAQLNEAVGPQHRKTRRVIEHLVSLYEDWDKPAQASGYRELLPSPAENTARGPVKSDGR